MKKQIAVGRFSISKATNDGSLFHLSLAASAGTRADKLMLFPAHYPIITIPYNPTPRRASAHPGAFFRLGMRSILLFVIRILHFSFFLAFPAKPCYNESSKHN